MCGMRFPTRNSVAIAGAALLSVASALGSQSRGALLALIATTFYLWTRSRGKLVSGAAFLVLGLTLVSFMRTLGPTV
jgi:putative inorganic carbon (hco3(-)) transporter